MLSIRIRKSRPWKGWTRRSWPGPSTAMIFIMGFPTADRWNSQRTRFFELDGYMMSDKHHAQYESHDSMWIIWLMWPTLCEKHDRQYEWKRSYELTHPLRCHQIFPYFPHSFPCFSMDFPYFSIFPVFFPWFPWDLHLPAPGFRSRTCRCHPRRHRPRWTEMGDGRWEMGDEVGGDHIICI